MRRTPLWMRPTMLSLLLIAGCGPGGGAVINGDNTAVNDGSDANDANDGADNTSDPGSNTTVGETGDSGIPLVGSSVLQFEGELPTNLLFLSFDTYRKDHVGVHGNLDLTPNFDIIASQGVVMNDHMQCSDWTYGSTTCTLAGRYNIDRGHIPRLGGNTTPVPGGTPFLSTWLGEVGVYSVLSSSNSWLSEEWGNTQGFDEEYSAGGANSVTNRGVEAIEDAIGRGDGDRWFLHLHFIEPHAAYDPDNQYIVGIDQLEPWPDDLTNRNVHYNWRDRYDDLDPDEQALLEAHLRLLYQGEIRQMDDMMGGIWGTLKMAGLLDDTLVVVWNDHGEQFWEHGNQTHAFKLYGEENDGFLMFWAANIVPGTFDGPTNAIDLVPTLLDLYGMKMPDEITGHAIGSAPADRVQFAEVVARSGPVQAAVHEGFKLQFVWNTGQVELYDRNTDPDEEVDLYDPTDPRVLDLWSHLKPMAELMDPAVDGGSPDYPAELP